MSAAITTKNEIPANAVYTMEIISRHRHGMNARAKVAKLQAEAPANVCYEHIVDQDGRVMVHHVYRYTVINMPTTVTEVNAPAEPTEASRSWGAAFAAVTQTDAAPIVSGKMEIPGNGLLHWGNDGHTACGFDGTDLPAKTGGSWCNTCNTAMHAELS